jgi:hypothetical protein
MEYEDQAESLPLTRPSLSRGELSACVIVGAIGIFALVYLWINAGPGSGPVVRYCTFFATIIPAHLLLLVIALRLFGKRWEGGGARAWLKLTGNVFLLTLVVDVIGLVPGIGGFVASVLWLVALKRLSGLDVLSTFMLSFTLGVVGYVGAVVLARHLQLPFLGP